MKMRTQDIFNWMVARQQAYNNKQSGAPQPYTLDPIIGKWRFCNVYREQDRVTVHIASHWREPMAGWPNLWFWMLVARLVNWPDTLDDLAKLALNDKWSYDKWLTILDKAEQLRGRVWGNAYIVSTNGRATNKAEYIGKEVLQSAWDRRKQIQPVPGDTLASFNSRLLTLHGIQGFMAGQIIADAKYADPNLRKAEDWQSFAISGPGSRRGLCRVLGHEVTKQFPERLWLPPFQTLHEAVNKLVARKPKVFPSPVHGQDMQNCLCEFDKYERVRLGEGTPRCIYRGPHA